MTVTGDTAAPAKQGGLFEDLIEVLYAPAKVFDRTRYAGVGKYLLATTAIILVIVVATRGLMQPFMDAQFDLSVKLQAAKGTPMPEQAIEAGRKFASITLIVISALTMLIGPLLNALFLMLSGKIFGASLPFGRAAVIAALAGVPRIFSWIAIAVQGLLLPEGTMPRSMADASLGPARFVDPETTSPAIVALLSNIDIFRIWQIVLLGIGVSVVAKVTRMNGYLTAVVAVGIATALSLIPGVLAG